MPPPSKRPAVERGNRDVENDPEKLQGTQAKIKVARGSRDAAADEDPELSKNTQAKMPSVARGAVSRGQRGKVVEDDPERGHNTEAKIKAQPGKARKQSNWDAPPGKMSGEQAKADPEYETASAYQSLDEEASDYHTGNDYEPLNPGQLNLEGDGLDALDADLGPPKTKGLEALLAEDAAAPEPEEDDDGANETRAGPPLSLHITAGPDQGKKKKFKGVRMVIGRTPGVDLQLSDQSVSRRHVELVQGDKGVLLRDLGSGNGTKVNGEKTAEKILEHGDEIHIGKTKLKFNDEMAAFKKLRDDQQQKNEEEEEAAKKKEEEAAAAAAAPAAEEAAPEGEGAAEGEAPADEAGPKTIARPIVDRADRRPVSRRGAEEPQGAIEKFKALEPKKRLMILGGAGVGLLLLILLIAATRPPPTPVVDPRQKVAAEKMQLARDAIRNQKYAEAIVLIEAAEKLQPGIDQSKLASSSRDELAIQKSLEAVRQMIETNRFDDARAELARMAKGSIKTEDEKLKVEEELKLGEAKFKRAKVEELLALGELEAAKQLLVELPDVDQKELTPRFVEAEDTVAAAKKAEDDAIKKHAIGSANQKKQRAEEEMAIAFAVVQRKFAGNEWQRAAAECDRVIDENPGADAIRKRAKLLQGLIPNFGRNYEEGIKKFREGQIASAARPLRQARTFYLQINLPTKLGGEIDEKLAQAAVMAGKEALLRDDLVSAAVNFRDAVKLDPNEGRARSGLDDVIAKAEDLYQSAYMIRDRDPREALKKFRVVEQVTPSGSATHEKAKNQIAAMSN